MSQTREVYIEQVALDLLPEIREWRKNNHYNLTIGIIGIGKMGLLHSGILNLLQPGIVKAVVDKSLLLRFGGSRILENVKFYSTLNRMLEEEKLDAVYITSPVDSHYQTIQYLLENKVNYVFVEKPPTLTYRQLEDLVKHKKSGQQVMVGFQKRYALPFRHAKKLLETHIVGEVTSVNAYIKSGDILSSTRRYDRIGRGVLLDLGSHLVDLLSWMFKITSVTSAWKQSIHTRVDDLFKAELETNGGARINVTITWSDPKYRMPETYIEVNGTKGQLKVTEDYLKIKTSKNHSALNNMEELSLYKPHYYQGIPPVILADPEYTIENIHFLQSIQEGKQPMTSIEEASRTMKMIDTLYETAG